jgi:hypothetical protein
MNRSFIEIVVNSIIQNSRVVFQPPSRQTAKESHVDKSFDQGLAIIQRGGDCRPPKMPNWRSFNSSSSRNRMVKNA